MTINKIQKGLVLTIISFGLFAAGCELIVDFDRTRIEGELPEASANDASSDGSTSTDAAMDAAEDASDGATESDASDAGDDASDASDAATDT